MQQKQQQRGAAELNQWNWQGVKGGRLAQGPAHFPGGLPAAPASPLAPPPHDWLAGPHPPVAGSAPLPSPSVSPFLVVFLLLHSPSRRHDTSLHDKLAIPHPGRPCAPEQRPQRTRRVPGRSACTTEIHGPASWPVQSRRTHFRGSDCLSRRTAEPLRAERETQTTPNTTRPPPTPDISPLTPCPACPPRLGRVLHPPRGFCRVASTIVCSAPSPQSSTDRQAPPTACQHRHPQGQIPSPALGELACAHLHLLASSLLFPTASHIPNTAGDPHRDLPFLPPSATTIITTRRLAPASLGCPSTVDSAVHRWPPAQAIEYQN